jgi:hypothetical protein
MRLRLLGLAACEAGHCGFGVGPDVRILRGGREVGLSRFAD